MRFRQILVVLLLALLITVMGVNLGAVERTTSPIESFWCSILDEYKTKLKVYNEEGEFAYQIELVLANETTFSKQKINMLKFILGVEEIKQPELKPTFFLYYLYKPKGASWRGFKLTNLVIAVPDLDEEIYLSDGEVRGSLAKYSPTSTITIGGKALTGAFITGYTYANRLREAKEKGYKVFLYYKGGGPRVELKLPGEI